MFSLLWVAGWDGRASCEHRQARFYSVPRDIGGGAVSKGSPAAGCGGVAVRVERRGCQCAAAAGRARLGHANCVRSLDVQLGDCVGDLSWGATSDVSVVAAINDQAHDFPPPAFGAAMIMWEHRVPKP